jgi:chromosome segregation ATPase
MEATLRLKVESLTQELTGYTAQLQSLTDAKTAAEASEARTASQLKSAQHGLRKYEATIERLTAENGKLNDRLQSEVRSAAILASQRERDAAQMRQHVQAAEVQAGATSKSLAASQEATRQALADLAEANATAVQLRDEGATQRALKLRQQLAATEQALSDQTAKLDRLAEQHEVNERRRVSDRKAWSVDRARLEG